MSFLMETERLALRRLAPTDWEPWRAYALSDRARLSFGAASIGEAWRRFAGLLGHWELRGFAPLAIVAKDERDCALNPALGMTGPYFPADWPEVELGWQIWDAAAEGTGIAHEAALAVRRWCADRFGWRRMPSYIAPGNTRSEALAARLGCTLDPAAPCPPSKARVWRHPAP